MAMAWFRMVLFASPLCFRLWKRNACCLATPDDVSRGVLLGWVVAAFFFLCFAFFLLLAVSISTVGEGDETNQHYLV